MPDNDTEDLVKALNRSKVTAPTRKKAEVRQEDPERLEETADYFAGLFDYARNNGYKPEDRFALTKLYGGHALNIYHGLLKGYRHFAFSEDLVKAAQRIAAKSAVLRSEYEKVCDTSNLPPVSKSGKVMRKPKMNKTAKMIPAPSVPTRKRKAYGKPVLTAYTGDEAQKLKNAVMDYSGNRASYPMPDGHSKSRKDRVAAAETKIPRGFGRRQASRLIAYK